MELFWNIIIDFCIVFWGPGIALIVFTQDCKKNACSAKERQKANILAKFLGAFVLFGLFVITPETVKESWQGLLDIPTIMISEHCFGIVVSALLVVLLSFYTMIFGDNVGVVIFYKYEKTRIIAICIHLLNSVVMIVYLLLFNMNGNINNGYWKYLLLFDLIMFVAIIVVSAIKVAYTEDGGVFEYNTVISQRKISAIDGGKFKVALDNEEYLVTNGEEEVRMKNLTSHQKEGIKKFGELVREKQNGI